MNRNIKKYNDDGYVIANFFNKEEYNLIYNFAVKWFYKICKIQTKDYKKFPIKKYHIWSNKIGLNHSEICSAKNRYLYPPIKIQKIIKNNKKIKKFLKNVGVPKFKMWDDGWGWIGFRIIRPKKNDGYPLSQKNWGIAKDVVSCWFPIVGKNKSDTLTLVPKSNKKNYEFYLPKNSKFTKGEYRLKQKYKNKIRTYNPKIKDHKVIIYSPKTLHSESNPKIKETRFNLEFRFKPILK